MSLEDWSQSRKQLVALIRDIEAKLDDIDCAENARRVLSRMLDGRADLLDMEPNDVKLLGKTGRERANRPRPAIG